MATDRPRDELSATLHELRVAAELSVAEASARSGIPQSSLSRYETGRILPPPGKLELLLAAYQAKPSVRRRVMKLARDRREQTRRVVLHRGAVRLQEQIRDLEASAARVRSFQPTIVPGIVQTEAYMRALLSAAPQVAEGVIRHRLERQRLLGQPPRRFELVVTAGALEWCMDGPEVMVAQLDRLLDVTRIDGVRLGVIPARTPTTSYALHGFDIYDETTVIVGTRAATAWLTQSLDVRAHVQLFAEMAALAVYDDAARAVLRGVRDEYVSDGRAQRPAPPGQTLR